MNTPGKDKNISLEPFNLSLLKKRGLLPIVFGFLILVVVVGVGSFFAGRQSYKKAATSIEKASEDKEKNSDETESEAISNIPPEHEYLINDRLVFNLMSNTESYSKVGSSIGFNCYDKYSLPEDEKISQLENELHKKQRAISTVCTNGHDNKVLLVSEDDVIHGNRNISIQLLDFYELTNYRSELLFQESDKENRRHFILIDWLTNGDIIFSLYDSSGHPRNLAYTLKTYLYNVDEFSAVPTPKLIEFCDIGIAGGTAQRGIRTCKRFVDSKTSLFFQQTDLP